MSPPSEPPSHADLVSPIMVETMRRSLGPAKPATKFTPATRSAPTRPQGNPAIDAVGIEVAAIVNHFESDLEAMPSSVPDHDPDDHGLHHLAEIEALLSHWLSSQSESAHSILALPAPSVGVKTLVSTVRFLAHARLHQDDYNQANLHTIHQLKNLSALQQHLIEALEADRLEIERRLNATERRLAETEARLNGLTETIGGPDSPRGPATPADPEPQL